MPENINCDPEALARASACYCFNENQATRVMIYLLARITGASLVPSELARNAACFCFTPGYSFRVMIALLWSKLFPEGSRPTTQTISSASACFCFPEPVQRAVTIYLLRQIAGLTMTPVELSRAASGMAFPSNVAVQIIAWLISTIEVSISTVILPDGSGGFWKLIVDVNGNVGTQSDPGPATADVILADGSGGFWKMVADTNGDRGAQSDAGPATFPVPVLSDGFGGNWQLVADTSGNVGATAV